jgi:hypothetical protein
MQRKKFEDEQEVNSPAKDIHEITKDAIKSNMGNRRSFEPKNTPIDFENLTKFSNTYIEVNRVENKFDMPQNEDNSFSYQRHNKYDLSKKYPLREKVIDSVDLHNKNKSKSPVIDSEINKFMNESSE